MLIGLTGAIGSGKSYISKMFKEKGFEVIDSDSITLLAYLDDNVKENLNKEFDCVENNIVNKKILKSKLNENTIPVLNKIVLPFIIDYISKIDHKNKYAIVETPLLFELDLAYLFDKTIAIDITDDLRNKLLLNRNKENYNFMKMLEKFQLSTDEKVRLADYVIVNNLENSGLNETISSIVIDLYNK